MNTKCMHVKCKSIVTIMWNILQESNFTSIKVLEQYPWCTTDYHQDNWLKFLSLAEYVHNNIIHSSTQQTLFYTNHDLHPKFDIQGVNKIMNSTTKDWVMCLANVWAQFVSNLEEIKRWYKENVDEHQKEQPSFQVKDQVWLQQQNIKTTRPSKKLDYERFCPFTIVKKINVLAFQFKFPYSIKIHHVFHICFLIRALPCIKHSRESPWTTFANSNRLRSRVRGGQNFWFKNIKLTNAIPNPPARIWRQRMNLGTS